MSGVVAIALAIGFGTAAGSFAAVMVASRMREAHEPPSEPAEGPSMLGPAISPLVSPEAPMLVDDRVDDLFDECTLESPTDYQAGAPRRASNMAYPNIDEGATNPDPNHFVDEDQEDAPTVLLGRGDWGQDVADLVAELDL